MIILLPGAIRISFFSDLGERLIKLFSETALNLFKICKNYNWCLLFACAFTRLKYVGNVLIQLYFGICFTRTISLRQKINFLRFYHRCIAFHRVQIRLNFFQYLVLFQSWRENNGLQIIFNSAHFKIFNLVFLLWCLKGSSSGNRLRIFLIHLTIQKIFKK